LLFGAGWLADLSNPAWFAFVSLWLFGAMFLSAFAVVRHAEALAVKLGEPYGTLILTLAVTGIEVMMIAAIMYAGKGNSALALYGVFLGIQTSRHPDYFTAPKLRRADGRREAAPVHEVHSVPFHTVLLIAYVLPLVVLSKQIAVPINHAIHVLHAPAAVGGFLVSV